MNTCSPLGHPSLPASPSAATDPPVCSPAQECACAALRELGSYCALPLQGSLLALPSRLHIAALQPANVSVAITHIIVALCFFFIPTNPPILAIYRFQAIMLLEAVAGAIGTLQAGGHGPPILSAIAPFVMRLQRLAADPAAAVTASAADGVLLAVTTHTDGSIGSSQLAALGTDEAAAESLVAVGRARGGAVTWHPASLRLEKVRGGGTVFGKTTQHLRHI